MRRLRKSLALAGGILLAPAAQADDIPKQPTQIHNVQESEAAAPLHPPSPQVQQGTNSIATTSGSKPNPSHEATHADRDLLAQESMATWASRMFLVGAIEILITLTGVILVGFTLRHTRRAADAAHATVASMEDTAKRQLRAYVVVSTVERKIHDIWPPEFVLTIKNSGQTPANRVRIRMGETLAAGEPESSAFNIEEEAAYEVSIGPGLSMEHLVFKESLKYLASGVSYSDFVRSKSPSLYMTGVIEYDDVFNRQQTTTFRFCYSAADIDGGNVMFCRHGNGAT